MTTRLHAFSIAATAVAASAAGGLLGAVLPVRAAAQAPPGIVTTAQVNLVDRAGRLRGVLSAEDERGMASLALFGPDGGPRAVLAAAPDGAPTFEMYDGARTLRVHATIQGTAPIVAVTADGGRQAILGGLSGVPALTLADGAQTRTEVGLTAGGLPGVHLIGPAGQRQVSLTVDREGQALVTMRDAGGRSRASLGVVQGATVVNLSDQMRTRVVMGVAPDGRATLSFLDEAGQVVRTLP